VVLQKSVSRLRLKVWLLKTIMCCECVF
jgi:hypothetical protein